MNSFNLFSSDARKKKSNNNKFSIPKWLFFIWGFTTLTVVMAAAAFFVGQYMNDRLTSEGTSIIAAIAAQSKLNDVQAKISSYKARNTAKDTVVTNRLSIDKIIIQMDTLTGSTILSYSYNKDNQNMKIVGRVNDPYLVITMMQGMRKSDYVGDVKLFQLAASTKNTYEYNILLILNREKIQTL